MEDYIYPLVVCEEEGKIVFFNRAAKEAFGNEEIYGRPLPPTWMDSETVQIETADEGTVPFRLIWEEILWDGNVAWYLAAVPAAGKGAGAAEEAQRLRAELEKSQEVIVDQEKLQERLEEAERQAQEAERLRAELEQSQEAAGEVDELRARYEHVKEKATAEVEQLRAKLEQVKERARAEVDQLRGRLSPLVMAGCASSMRRLSSALSSPWSWVFVQ